MHNPVLSKKIITYTLDIGYVLPPFKEYTWRVSVNPNVHFLIYFFVLDICCQHLGNIRH